MGYIENYIRKEDYAKIKQSGRDHYNGFVIGYGYITMKCRVVMPPNQYGYSPTWTNMPPAQTHCFMFHEYDEDLSAEAYKLSLRGLFKDGRAVVTVRSGMTLSRIASLFDVTVNELVRWNNIEDPNKIHVGQRISIFKHSNGLPEYIKRQTSSSDSSNTPENVNVLVEKDSSWFEDNFVSQTETMSIKEEFDGPFYKLSLFKEETKGDAKLFNHGIIGTSVNKGLPEYSNAYELNLRNFKVGGSHNSISTTISANGYIEAETSIEFNDIWDFSLNLNIREDLNRNNFSSGVGLQIQPIKASAYALGALGIIASYFFLGKFVPSMSPSINGIGPIMPNKEVY